MCSYIKKIQGKRTFWEQSLKSLYYQIGHFPTDLRIILLIFIRYSLCKKSSVLSQDGSPKGAMLRFFGKQQSFCWIGNGPPAPWHFSENSSKFGDPIVPRARCVWTFYGDMVLWYGMVWYGMVRYVWCGPVVLRSMLYSMYTPRSSWIMDSNNTHLNIASISHIETTPGKK